MALKQRMCDQGSVFTSETDAEVIAHLVARNLDGDLPAAVRAAYAELEGHFAFVAMSAEDPDVLVGARKECPLVVGRGDGEQFIASAVSAFLAETRRVQFLRNDEIIVLRSDEVQITTAAGEPVNRPIEDVDWDAETAEKGGFETFMLKEIHEQADAVAETIADRTARQHGVDLTDEGAMDESLLEGIQRIVIVACGTSYHAGLIGRYAIEEWARLPVEIDIASEYRYRNPVVGPGDLVVGITQSGETADTLAAMRLARERGARVIALTNVMGSQATRDADGVLFTRAGLEIGVAATKTFVCQVAIMYLLGLRLAELRGTLDGQRLAELVSELKRMPHCITELMGSLDGHVEEVADRVWQSEFFLYLGRHVGLPVALEGALKLKEISYISTDAYAAGEMKHGPIALLGEHTPVVCVATESPVLDKVISNIQEVRARGADVVAIGTAGDERVPQHADATIAVPAVDWMLQPILAVIPLQLLAYHIARKRGLNVDQPRNLAKTVTVE
jgi:glucosamine--fructose-6-phosphate aminotransferase (isomerizing)